MLLPWFPHDFKELSFQQPEPSADFFSVSDLFCIFMLWYKWGKILRAFINFPISESTLRIFMKVVCSLIQHMWIYIYTFIYWRQRWVNHECGFRMQIMWLWYKGVQRLSCDSQSVVYVVSSLHQAHRVNEILPGSELDIPSLPTDRKLKVCLDYPQSPELTDERFEMVDTGEEADIIWTRQSFKDFT